MHTAVRAAIIAQASATPMVEVCGLIYYTLDSVHAYPCANVALDPVNDFEVAANDYVAAAVLGKVCGIYHSHPTGPAAFSDADLETARDMCLPMYLWSVEDSKMGEYIPPTYVVPLEGRQWIWGMADCYETIRIYYRQCHDLYMGDYVRDDSWSGSTIVDHIADEGFEYVQGNSPIKVGDALLFNTVTAYPQHLAVFLGAGRMLHHPLYQLSRSDQFTTCRLRHRWARYDGRLRLTTHLDCRTSYANPRSRTHTARGPCRGDCRCAHPSSGRVGRAPCARGAASRSRSCPWRRGTTHPSP